MNDRGEISVWRRLDYEQEQKFHLRIVASDGLHTDYANVTITIMDVNGNIFKFLWAKQLFLTILQHYKDFHYPKRVCSLEQY